MGTPKKVRPIAVFNKPRKISDFIAKVNSIVGDMTDNVAIFVTPVPALATVTTHNTALATAETLARTRVEGAASARNVSQSVVLTDVLKLVRYVQSLADDATDVEVAINIILSAGLQVKGIPSINKPTLKVKPGNTPGSLLLIAKAVISFKTVYHWQKSTDGIAWTDLPISLVAKTLVTGLTDGKYYFRFFTTTPQGESGWCDAVHGWVNN